MSNAAWIVGQVAAASDRCTVVPDRIDAFCVARGGHVIAVASTRIQARHDTVRKLVRRIIDFEDAAPPGAIDRGPRHFNELFSEIDVDVGQLDVLVASFGDRQLEITASPGVRCFRLRAGKLSSANSRAPGVRRISHHLRSGDAFAICTEGVYGALSEGRIQATLLGHDYAHEVAWALVEAGRRVNSRSDVTAIVVR